VTEPRVRNVSFGDCLWEPYPEYKDSGIEWLGEIPTHWETHRLKHVATINDDALPEDMDPDYEISYVDIGNVDATEGIVTQETYLFEDAPSRARRVVHDGDVIVSTVRTYLRAIAPIVNPEPNLIVSTGFAVIRPRYGLLSNFASYVLRAPYFVDHVVAESVGVSYPAINAWQLGTLRIGVPTEEEQQAIAGFLDRETAKIDSLVEKKERLIELLQEKRTALITHAVTKGLDPDVPIKDSGIEWLGEIPAHWEVKPLRHVIHGGLTNGLFKKKEFFGSGTLLVNVFDIYRRDFLVDKSTLERVQSTDTEVTQYGVLDGDIFFVRSSLKLDGIGRSATIKRGTEPVVFECHLVRARPIATVADSRFLINYLNSGYGSQRIISLANTVTMSTVGQDSIKGLSILTPPLPEQQAIADYLDRETAKIDTLIAKVGEAIERLKEYRTALISAAVTGKIDVRRPVKYGGMGGAGYDSGLSMRG
jgi:type I restriction enzyme S subunit